MQILTRKTVQVNLNQLIHPITILQVLLNHVTADPITMFNFALHSSFSFEMASLLLSVFWDHCSGCHQSNSPVMFGTLENKVLGTL